MADKKRPPKPPAFTPLSELPAPKMPSVPDRVLEPFEAKSFPPRTPVWYHDTGGRYAPDVSV